MTIYATVTVAKKRKPHFVVLCSRSTHVSLREAYQHLVSQTQHYHKQGYLVKVVAGAHEGLTAINRAMMEEEAE